LLRKQLLAARSFSAHTCSIERTNDRRNAPGRALNLTGLARHNFPARAVTIADKDALRLHSALMRTPR
jgi:hypothetical protein